MGVAVMISWLQRTQNQSAQILILVAGGREVDMTEVALRCASKACKGGWQITTVEAQNASWKLPKIMDVLRKQWCRPGDPPQLVIMPAGLGEDSLTLVINGLVNTGQALSTDENGFLQMRPESMAERTQREGRAGRVMASAIFHLCASPLADQMGCVDYAAGLQCCLVRIALRMRSCGSVLPAATCTALERDLTSLGCLDSSGLTAMGLYVVQQSGDVRVEVLKYCCKVFGIARIGEIAAAFIACSTDLFLPALVGSRASYKLSLDPSQTALGEHNGFREDKACLSDLHTAVVVFFALAQW